MATATKKRLTRGESRALTRARLLDAAEELFVERGFNGASVEEIAERAGYTRGAFYSNFEDKDDAFVALLDKNLEERIEEIGRIMRDASTLDAAFELIRRGNEKRKISPWAVLQTEFWLYAVRNPAARRKLARLQRAERKAYERAVEAQFRTLDLEPPRLDDAALLLQIVDEGAPRQRLIDPDEVRKDFFFDAVLELFAGAVALARERSAKR